MVPFNPQEEPNPLPLESWLAEIVRHPLEPEEANGALDPGDPHQNPDVALRLEPSGVPTWWPNRHPESGEELSPERRQRWFLDWLAGELSPAQEILQSGELNLRRQMIAQSLLLTHAESRTSEIPILDS